MSGALSSRDLRAVLDGAGELLAVRDPAELPLAALALIDRLVPSLVVSYNQIDVTQRTATVLTRGPQPGSDLMEVFARYAHQNPLVAYQAATGDGSPRRMSDFITRREMRRRPLYDLVYRPLGVESQLAFAFSGPAGAVTGIACSRDHSDFSAADVAVLEILRPLLVHIFRLRQPRARPAPADAAPPAVRLTRRQDEVMMLLAQGATNVQIAAELNIAEKTAAKHLEHIFRQLEVSNRTAALAAWRQPRG